MGSEGLGDGTWGSGVPGFWVAESRSGGRVGRVWGRGGGGDWGSGVRNLGPGPGEQGLGSPAAVQEMRAAKGGAGCGCDRNLPFLWVGSDRERRTLAARPPAAAGTWTSTPARLREIRPCRAQCDARPAA